MRISLILAAATLGLALATGTARADHDRDVGRLIGGVLLGAALADLAHDRRHAYHGHRYAPVKVKHRHKHGRRAHRHDRDFHGYRYAPRRHWQRDRRVHAYRAYR